MNKSIQGRDEDIITAKDKIPSFMKNINWWFSFIFFDSVLYLRSVIGDKHQIMYTWYGKRLAEFKRTKYVISRCSNFQKTP